MLHCGNCARAAGVLSKSFKPLRYVCVDHPLHRFDAGAEPLRARPPADQILICFSHLRWNFVFQRPQHLMSRFAQAGRVIFWEEPEAALPEMRAGAGRADLRRDRRDRGDARRSPRASRRRTARGGAEGSARRLSGRRAGAVRPLVLHADDAAFLAASRGGLHRLRLHGRARQFPLRAARAARARARAARRAPTSSSPAATASTRPSRTAIRTSIPSPRASTAPISARRAAMDAVPGRPGRAAAAAPRLLRRRSTSAWTSTCSRRWPTPSPNGRSSIVGPVVKIDPADLPQRPNIHYLGGKTYEELPAYLARLGRRADAVRDQRIRPGSSRRPRRPNISPAAARSSRLRSPTSSAIMAISRRCSSPTAPRRSSSALRGRARSAPGSGDEWLRRGRRSSSPI